MEKELLHALQNLQESYAEKNDSETESEIESQHKTDLIDYIEKITGYSFKNTNLLLEAFTSLKEDHWLSNIIMVGDSTLNFLITMHIHKLYLSPNVLKVRLEQLILLRAANVDIEKLARVAFKYNLYQYVTHHNPLLSKQIEDFKDAIVEYPLHSSGLVDVPKGLADIVKALIGAIFLDSRSVEATWQVTEILLQPIISLSTLDQAHPAINTSV